MKKVLLFLIFVFVLLALVRPVLWMYEFFIVQNKTSLSDVLNYCLNILPGIIALISSCHTFRILYQNEVTSLGTSKRFIYDFIIISCTGFMENYHQRNFRYCRLKIITLESHLKKLTNANILSESEANLCRTINFYVRNINNKTSDEIKDIYNEFWNGNEYKENVKKVLDKLEESSPDD